MDALDTFHHIVDSIFDVARWLPSLDLGGKALSKTPLANHVDQFEKLILIYAIGIGTPAINLGLPPLAPFSFVKGCENFGREPSFVQIGFKGADVGKDAKILEAISEIVFILTFGNVLQFLGERSWDFPRSGALDRDSKFYAPICG